MDMKRRSGLSAAEAFAEQLRAERAAARMSQGDLAKRAGISLSTMKRLEKNERELDTTVLDQLCRAMGLPLIEFVQRAEQRRVIQADDPLPEASGK